MIQKLISKNDFKNNLESPKYYWFKNEIELSEWFLQIHQKIHLHKEMTCSINDGDNDESDLDNPDNDFYELLFDSSKEAELFQALDQMNEQEDQAIINAIGQKTVIELLKIVENSDFSFLKNHFLIYKKIYQLIEVFLAKNFQIDFVNINNHSNLTENDSHDAIMRILSKPEFIIIKPKIIYKNFVLNPSAIIKKRQKIYVIEAKLSTSQKNKNILDFVFFEKIILQANFFQVDCYLNLLIQKVNKQPNDPIAQFILTPFVPYTQTISLTDFKNVSQGTSCFDNINASSKKKYFMPLLPEIQNKIIYLAAARPVIWEFEKDQKQFSWKNFNLININNFLKKKLNQEDYFIEFVEDEQLSFYNYYYSNAQFHEALEFDNWTSYFEVFKMVNEDNKKKPETTFKDKEHLFNTFLICLIWPSLFNYFEKMNNNFKMKLPYKFEDFFDLNNFNDQELNWSFLATYEQDRLFNSNPKWKKLLTTLVPEANYSGLFLRTNLLFHLTTHLNPDEYKDYLRKKYYGNLFDDDKRLTLENYLVSNLAVEAFEEYLQFPNKVYYDFESISLPISIMDHTKPYQQIVNQISIIKNIDNKGIEHCDNLVYDPLNLNSNIFKEIIDLIYVDPVNEPKYVVYNKAFENTRLKEMAVIINEPVYFDKVIAIIENTFDLADYFDIRKKYILAQSLKGAYSIKKVIELVPDNILAQAKAVSYKKIEKVQNGVVCQNLAIQRFLNQIKNEVWQENVELMKLYCENDVRSMIAAEYLIAHIIENAQQANKVISSELLIKE